MREGRTGGGYDEYTRDKDALVAGEVGLYSTYDEEVFEYHEKKQREIFTREKETRKRIERSRRLYIKTIEKLFANEYGVCMLNSLKEFRKGGEKHIGQYQINNTLYKDVHVLCEVKNTLSLMQIYLVKPEFSIMLTDPNPYNEIDMVLQLYDDRLLSTEDRGE